jgi:hypothetical protein
MVPKLQAEQLKNRGSNPGRGNVYSMHRNPYQWVPELKGPMCEVDNLPPTTPKVEWMELYLYAPYTLAWRAQAQMTSLPPIVVSVKGVR